MSDQVLNTLAEVTSRLTSADGPFALEEVDVGGHPTTVYASADVNLVGILQRAEAQYADRDLVIDEGRSWSYGAIFGASRRLAASLRDDYGIKAGDHVGIVMRNRPEWFIAFAAALRMGAVAVLINSRGAADELAAASADARCSVVIADDERLALMRLGGVETPLVGLDELERLTAGDRPGLDATVVDADAPAAILFTSGTTGRPKGAVLTQRNLSNMVRNLAFVTEINLAIAAASHGVAVDALRGMMPRLSSLLVFPLFHISGLNAFFITIENGGLLTTMRRWNAAEALRLIVANRITMLSGPPLVLDDLLDEPGAADKLATIGTISIGGQATPRSLVDRLARELPRTGQSAGWGMTETTGSITAAAGAVYMAKSGSCGCLSPISALRILDEEGRDVPPGQHGELWAGGALLMQGYYNAPEANAAVMSDGWLRTGDIGYLDEDGFLHLVARLKDMVISAGENIYCAEVERVLATEGDFVEVALFGVADARLGERAIAAITLREGADWDEAKVRSLARRSLAEYKVPAEVVFDLGALPRNATGKVDKAALRTRYLERVFAA